MTAINKVHILDKVSTYLYVKIIPTAGIRNIVSGIMLRRVSLEDMMSLYLNQNMLGLQCKPKKA